MTTGRSLARWVGRVAFVLAVGVLSTCSPSGPSVVDGGSYSGNFTFQWDEVNAGGTFVTPLHRFTLLTDQTGTTSGTFNNQSSETQGTTRNVLTGTFNNRDLTLSVQRSTGNVSITGRFLTDDTIEMREPGRTYTVRRNTTP
jgi:hypothetical protein